MKFDFFFSFKKKIFFLKYFVRPSFSIDNAHPPYVRDVDYNPNRQYYLMTCGDDCRVKFWDVRKPTECLKILSDHSHWLVVLSSLLNLNV